MKSDKNGFLVTNWKKIKTHFCSRSRFLDLFSFSLLIWFSSLCFVSLITLACLFSPDGVTIYVLAGCSGVSVLCALSFILSACLYFKISSFLIDAKSSGSAPDENIKNIKMEGKCENEKND